MKINKKGLLLIVLIIFFALFIFFFSKRNIKTVPLLKGTEVETTMTIIKGKNPGKCVFIVGGVHGDEIAGWKAANKLKSSIKIDSGTVYIISPANKQGSVKNLRYIDDYRDLNRAFPGTADGNNAQMLAHAIFMQIQEHAPSIVLDLHEAHILESSQDFLGSSVIFTALDGMENLLPDLIAATANGTICSEPFNYFGPGPKGSINRTVTQTLNIPVITVETYREYPLERRISDHMDIVNYVLSYYEMT